MVAAATRRQRTDEDGCGGADRTSPAAPTAHGRSRGGHRLYRQCDQEAFQQPAAGTGQVAGNGAWFGGRSAEIAVCKSFSSGLHVTTAMRAL